jgi:hypothetical protein
MNWSAGFIPRGMLVANGRWSEFIEKAIKSLAIVFGAYTLCQ